MDAKELAVRGLELFSECSRAEIGWVVRHGDVLDVTPGAVVARRGGYAKEFVVLLAGSATSTSGDGSRRTLRAGAHLGSQEITGDRPYSADVVADDGLRLLVFESRAFRGFAERAPTVARKLQAQRTTVRQPVDRRAHTLRRRVALAS